MSAKKKTSKHPQPVASSPSFTALISAASEAKRFTPGGTPLSGRADLMADFELSGDVDSPSHGPAMSPGLAALSAASLGDPESGMNSFSLGKPRGSKRAVIPSSKAAAAAAHSSSQHNGLKRARLSPPPPPPPMPSSSKRLAPSSADAAGGSSCHQCKSRRSYNDLTYCKSNLNKKKHCRKKYCEHCLKKFYKESPHDIADKNKWACPSCRKLCCCAACRRREMKLSGGVDVAAPMSSSKGFKGDGGSSAPPPLPPSAIKNLPQNLIAGNHGTLTPAAMFHYMNNSASQDSEAFSLLYGVAQMPNVKKHIRYILAREDINDGQKVETIASLLRGAVSTDDGDDADDGQGSEDNMGYGGDESGMDFGDAHVHSVGGLGHHEMQSMNGEE